MPINAESSAITDIGLKRQNNEDVFAVHDEANFYVLADGMGGHQAGEVAAKLAVERLCSLFISSLEKAEKDDPLNKLANAIQEANTHVYQMATSHSEWSGMGTTLTCIFFHGQTMVYAHVGDSRIYRMRGKLEQLTEDHSMRKDPSSRYKNKLTRAIGTSLFVDPEMGSAEVLPGDLYLICSDGLTDHVPDPLIAELIRLYPTTADLCPALVEAAKADGGFDNITLIAIKILEKS